MQGVYRESDAGIMTRSLTEASLLNKFNRFKNSKNELHKSIGCSMKTKSKVSSENQITHSPKIQIIAGRLPERHRPLFDRHRTDHALCDMRQKLQAPQRRHTWRLRHDADLRQRIALIVGKHDALLRAHQVAVRCAGSDRIGTVRRRGQTIEIERRQHFRSAHGQARANRWGGHSRFERRRRRR